MNLSIFTLRKATPEDALPLAELINYAGEGLPLYWWQKIAEPGETALDVGCQRARREEGGFSYRNALIAYGTNDEILACLITHIIDEKPEPIDSETPPLFVPLLELENLAPPSWYINVVATYPAYRGQGVGTVLLKEAEKQAAENNLQCLSLIVFDSNEGALRLYEKHGYKAITTRKMVKEDWDSKGENYILMVKDC